MSRLASSGSDGNATRYANMDERKRKRMISNRESARRSRLKKQKQIENLVNEKCQLERLIKENTHACDTISQRLTSLQGENSVLMTEKMRQERYLEYLESIIDNNGHVRMVSGHKKEEDSLLKMPWQNVHGSSPHALASAGMFRF